MRTGNDLTWAPYRTFSIGLIVAVLAGAGTLLATHASPHHGVGLSSQASCPTQADCDRLKQIADTAAAAAAAAHAVANQAQADREKDLATANQMEREGEFPSSPLAKDMRPSDRVELGQAKRAQAKALRDKLPNAQANAKAADEAAAAARKASDDCAEKLKACPPTSVPVQTTTNPNTTGTTTGTPTGTGNGGRGGRGANSTRVECLDGTTSSTVLPLKVEYKMEFGLRFNWYGDPKFQLQPDKNVFQPRPCRLNGQDGSLELGIPWSGVDGTIPPFQNGVPTWVIPPVVTPTPPVSGGGTFINPAYPRLRARIINPRYDYIRPVIYRDYYSQLMDYLGWLFFGDRCDNDFPYTLQKQLGITTACRPSKPPRVVASRSVPATDRARLQAVSLRSGTAGADGRSPSGDIPFGQDPTQGRGPRQPRGMPTEGFPYSIVSNGKSTGEAFQLQLVDSTGKVKSVRMPEGTVLEAIRPGVTQPVTARGGANLVTQPLNGFCLEFEKQPPAEGTMYRIADEETQQKYRSLRYLSGAGAQMKQKNMFHPDSNPAAYNDAIMQYAVWVKMNGWTLEQFIQHFIERTKKNAEALKVKWTAEMETTLRNAGPGRWGDISEMLKEAQDLEKAAEGRRGGRGGRGGRSGAQPEE